MIIGPMIKKMREKEAEKNKPMIDGEDAMGQAAGLRVGGSAWKWPPVWPYQDDIFTPTADIQTPDPSAQLQSMAGMMSGAPQIPSPEEVEVKEVETLDEEKYWGEDKGETRTELDEEAAARLTSHLQFYLKDGMSILEFGAAENSYLPEDLKPSRHVGVGLNEKLMEENPALTEKLIVNLNKVVPERDVDSDELRKLTAEPFDAIIMTNTIDFLTNPREVFKTAWYLLKPGGSMIVSFTTKNSQEYVDKFQRAQVKAWRDFNDDQHMWIAGSFFQFSAGEGWEKLLGFDISPESAKENLESNGGLLGRFKEGKDNNMYVVQAVKASEAEDIDPNDIEKSISSRMWMLPTMESRDKKLVTPRLARGYEKATSEEQRDAVKSNLATLPKIYEALIKMDQFAFNFLAQSQLAADLVLAPGFNANDEQVTALKQGLGLLTPSEEFWQPVGMNTANMELGDKINLLAYVVPRFGSGDSEQEAALSTFASGIVPTIAVVKKKLPDLSASDAELLATELLCAEILVPGRSTKEEFAAWLESMSDADLRGILNARKTFNEDTETELTEFREKNEAEKKRIEDLRAKYQEQVKKAREERTMVYNPRTGKFQEFNTEKDKGFLGNIFK